VNSGPFSLTGYVTYTKPKLLNLGTTPHGVPTIQYVMSPSFDTGFFAIGASVNGQGSQWSDDGNTLKLPGLALVNGFVKVRPYKGLELAMNVNNLFNTIAYPGGGNIQQQLSATTAIFDSSSAYGRTIQASVRYRF